MAHFLVFWGRHWGTGVRPRSVGTANRIGGIFPGDKIFVLLTGSSTGRRIIACGSAASAVFRGPHYRDPAKTTNWVDVDWDTWLSDNHGMSLDQAKEAAPGFYWRNPQGGGIRIEEGESLQEAWQEHLASLPETAFISEPDQPPAAIERVETRSTFSAPIVRVDFHDVVSGPDPWGGGTFRADRHYLDASSVHQDAHETIFVRSSGEIACRWPTSKIRSIKWLGTEGDNPQRIPTSPNGPRPNKETSAEIPPHSDPRQASAEDEAFTSEMIAKRREILDQAGSGTPNWDGDLYRSLMDEAGIPHSGSPSEARPTPPDAASPTTESSSTTSAITARAGESWTEDENDLLIEEVRAGANVKDIAQMHGRSEGAIRSRLKKVNLVTHDSEIVHLFFEGWTIDELAGTFGDESTALRERFIRSGITPNKPSEGASPPEDIDDRRQSEPHEQPSANPPQADVPTLNDEPCRHDIPQAQCSTCKYDGEPDVYISDGGAAFHGHADCPALESGQRAVERRGGDTAEIRRVSRGSSELADRQPCIVCLPGGK